MTLSPGAGALSRSAHDEFLELCAISTAGELTGEEQKGLQKHLAVCPSCREAMTQYDAMVRKTIPALARDPQRVASDPGWSQEQAEAALFHRLALEEELDTDRWGADGDFAPKAIGRVPLSASQTTWRNVWALCAACGLLCVALGVSAYQVGIRRGVRTAAITPSAGENDQAGLEQQVGDAGYERQVLKTQIEQRDKEISSLRKELRQQSAAINRMKLTQTQLETTLQSRQADRQDLFQPRSDLSQRLEAAQAKIPGLQDKIDSLERQSSEDKQRATMLEAKVADLTHLLQDREATIDQQQELLAHDRDIRELMGARDLYVSEVFDVSQSGTEKPYGRVFYTRGKSLIFYAYDLDRQIEAKNGTTFQAWGRDREQTLNLGVFYEDSAAKKRWILRFDDQKTLAQIDAVFVTVEPNGGSIKPSTKPLLFAYLRIAPNHP
jgi:hypothetical protein